MWLSVVHWFSFNPGIILVTKPSGSAVMTQLKCCIALQITVGGYLSNMNIDIFTSPGFLITNETL